MHPNLASADVCAAETLDADRQIGASPLFVRLREIAVALDQCRIKMQAGVEERRMQAGLAIMGEMRRQPNPRQDLAVAPLQRFDGLKRCAIFQSQSTQVFVIAIDRNRTDTPLP